MRVIERGREGERERERERERHCGKRGGKGCRFCKVGREVGPCSLDTVKGHSMYVSVCREDDFDEQVFFPSTMVGLVVIVGKGGGGYGTYLGKVDYYCRNRRINDD